MSLKHFHIVFIILAVLCTLGFGAWALLVPLEMVGIWGRVGGAMSALAGLALIPYGIWFLKKSKGIIL